MTEAVFCLYFFTEALNPMSCVGDSESAFKNTSIEHNVNFRKPIQKNLDIRIYSDLACSWKYGGGHFGIVYKIPYRRAPRLAYFRPSARTSKGILHIIQFTAELSKKRAQCDGTYKFNIYTLPLALRQNRPRPKKYIIIHKYFINNC